MTKSARQLCISVAIILLALAFRVLWLDFKPAHFDEGVNGAFVDGMRRDGCYRYDPANYHGPLHFYVTFAAQQLFGRSLWVLRMPTALIGTATVALMLAFSRFLPRRTVWIAAVAAAISPAMIFYSRYAIHEAWLPFFTLLAIYGGFGLASDNRRYGDIWTLGLGLTGMVLSKETYIIHWFAALLAIETARGLEWFAPAGSRRRRPRPIELFEGKTTHAESRSIDEDLIELDDSCESGHERPAASMAPGGRMILATRDLMQVTMVCGAIIVLFYSGFFLNWPGLTGLFEMFSAMVTKGTSSEEGHQKEFFYWLKLVGWYEWPAAVGILAAPMLALRQSAILTTIILAAGALLAGSGYFDGGAAPASESHPDFLAPRWNLNTQTSLGLWFIAIGFCCFVTTQRNVPRVRWLCLYGLGCLTAYSLVPYKTPWCIINILWPFFFALGHLGNVLMQLTDRRLVCFVGALLAWTPLTQSWRLNFRFPTDDRHRYAYVQTSFDINKLLEPVRELTRENPLNRQMHGIVMTEAFPLIWELNDFPNITYTGESGTVRTYDADFLLVPDTRETEVDGSLLGLYFKERIRHRGGADDAWLYLNAATFGAVFPGRSPEFRPRVRHSPVPADTETSVP